MTADNPEVRSARSGVAIQFIGTCNMFLICNDKEGGLEVWITQALRRGTDVEPAPVLCN